jgi:transcription initiation factor TFIID subunit 9B
MDEDPVVPRDARILHLILAAQSIQSYEDHIPLQLMDFAHRYTLGVLKDAVIYNDHSRSSNGATATPGSKISTDDVRLAIAARTNYQFNAVTPKEMLLELAAERNKKTLPPIMPGFGIRLPPEKYCLTNKEWSLSDEELDKEEDHKMEDA